MHESNCLKVCMRVNICIYVSSGATADHTSGEVQITLGGCKPTPLELGNSLHAASGFTTNQNGYCTHYGSPQYQ